MIASSEFPFLNILQTISETFGGWVLLDAGRDDTGAITEKRVLLKNYLGKDNYAKIQYGLNLKDITRTYESKNIVTKLIVKQNSNELAPSGFCNISRTKVNPTGENYIYDFQYYFNKELLDPDLFIEELYNEDGKTDTNIKGYFPRLRRINDQILKINEELEGYYSDLTKLKAEAETVKQGFLKADEELRLTEEDFWTLTGQDINSLLTNQATYTFTNVSGTNFPYKKYEIGELGKLESGKIYISELDTKVQVDNSNYNYCSSQGYLRVTLKRINGISGEIQGQIIITPLVNEGKNTLDTNFVIPADKDEADVAITLSPVDITRSDVRRLINDYQNYYTQKQDYDQRLLSLLGREEYRDFRQLPENLVIKEVSGRLASKETQYKDTVEARQELLDEKEALNKLFFTKYSRFIQEGTWISEEYVDDDKYYHDACSVLYNSCYPKVAYSINLMELSALPGYELFEMEVGDKTFVVDPEFFGDEGEVEIVVNQKSENLDSPEKSTISVQNFKNQFQDLFQKITATVQQAQYSQGSYEKAVALAEASDTRKMSFVSDALSDATAKLSAAGQQSVEWGNDGITITDVNTSTNSVRMIGGAILLSKQDEKTGELKWTTGMTADGISASLITAGRLNTNEIAIMNGDDILFRWDSFGISAFDYARYADGTVDVVSQVNPEKFVRFDKYGLYGMNQKGLSGLSWTPNDNKEIDQLATFALTWEGLKVTSGAGTILRIGDGAKVDPDDNYILNVKNKYGKVCFGIDGDGNLTWGDSSPDFSRNDLLGVLDVPVDGQPPQDGIYNDGGNIGINASAIKTGALLVGSLDENQQPSDKTILYANVDQPEVYLAGWNVKPEGLVGEVEGDDGETYKIGLYPSGKDLSETKATIYSNPYIKKWTKTINGSIDCQQQEAPETFKGKLQEEKAQYFSSAIVITKPPLELVENQVLWAYFNEQEFEQNDYGNLKVVKDTIKTSFTETDTNYQIQLEGTAEAIRLDLTSLSTETTIGKGYQFSANYNVDGKAEKYTTLPMIFRDTLQNSGGWGGTVQAVWDPAEGQYICIQDTTDRGQGVIEYKLSEQNQMIQCSFDLRINPYDFEGFNESIELISLRLTNGWKAGKNAASVRLSLYAFENANNNLQLILYNDINKTLIPSENIFELHKDEASEWLNFSLYLDDYEYPGSYKLTVTSEDQTVLFEDMVGPPDKFENSIPTYLQIVANSSVVADYDIRNVQGWPVGQNKSDYPTQLFYQPKFNLQITENYAQEFPGTFYVTVDGGLYATKGKIGTVEITDIMSAKVDGKFSWKFSPTDGMFMWNGGIPTNYSDDTDKTKGAIFAIYNDPDLNEDGTFKNDHYKLSMRGHVEAESGQIGPLTIKQQNGSNTTILETTLLSTLHKTGTLSIGKDGINISYNTNSGGEGGVKVKIGDEISYNDTTGEHITIDSNGITAKNSHKNQFLKLQYNGILFQRSEQTGGVSDVGSIRMVDNGKSLEITIDGKTVYLYFDNNYKPVWSTSAPTQNE